MIYNWIFSKDFSNKSYYLTIPLILLRKLRQLKRKWFTHGHTTGIMLSICRHSNDSNVNYLYLIGKFTNESKTKLNIISIAENMLFNH